MAKQRHKPAKIGSIEWVEWDDAVADIGWERASDTGLAVQKCVSVGKVVREDERTLVLAGTWGAQGEGDEDTNCRIAIPKGWISKRSLIKMGNGVTAG